ncbi:MAG: patatin-like phospholipase family protein [Aquincola sp.]|nr:patatin-like phospholipase family protein [Aquincola sp.]
MEASDDRARFDPDNMLYDGAARIVKAELDYIETWRGRPPEVGLALSGGGIRSASVCLGVLQALAHEGCLQKVDYLSTVSGGGYIGASLSYLLHQSAREAHSGAADTLPKFDVSRENFPYVSYPMVSVKAPETGRGQDESLKGRLLRRLRQNVNYLAPGGGVTLLSLAGVLLRGVSASVVVHAAVLVVLFQCLFSIRVFGLNPEVDRNTSSAEGLTQLPAANAVLMIAAGAFLLYALLSVVYVPLTRAFDRLEKQDVHSVTGGAPVSVPYRIRRLYDVLTHWLFVVAIAAFVIGALPWTHEFLAKHDLLSLRSWLDLLGQVQGNKPAAVGAVATVVGVIGSLWGYLQARSDKKPRVPTALVVWAASIILMFGVLLLAFVLTRRLNLTPGIGAIGIVAVALGILVLFGWVPEANYLSLHRFYRDRLLELFMPDLRELRKRMLEGQESRIGPSLPGDATMLGDICREPAHGERMEPAASSRPKEDKLLRGPYHIINANVVLVSSTHPRYRARGGDNFILSPLFCGSRATHWVETERSPVNGFTLATAMAISGAAVNSNAGPGGEGITRQPVLSVLMGMLNLRLGYWATNPNWNRTAKASMGAQMLARWSKPNMLYPGLFESFGRMNLREDEDQRFVLLTDGGHFENLGLYELARRRLKLIIVCDATADPAFKFADLANAIEKARTDFGAIIDVRSEDLAALVPKANDSKKETRPELLAAERGYLIAPIRYSLRSGQGSEQAPEHGTLIYLKSTFFKGLTADLQGYRNVHPGFPNQSTGDQFFDEKQFEAYRELGFQTGLRMLRDLKSAAAGSHWQLEQDARSALWD